MEMYDDLVHPPHPLYIKLGTKLILSSYVLAQHYILLYSNIINSKDIVCKVEEKNGLGIITILGAKAPED
jgi:hypothetical protein